MRSHRVVGLAAATGVATGLLVALFEHVVVEVLFANASSRPLVVVALLPTVGLVVSALVRRVLAPGTGPATADEYLHAFHDPAHPLRLRPFVARLLGATATLGSGVPMGLEGPSLYSGATIGATIQRRLPRSFRGADHRVLMVAGAAAGVAAIFKAPATGAVFALEVPYQDDFARRMLLPALVASATGYLAFVAVHGTDALFPVSADAGLVWRDLAGALVVGAVAGVGARGFAWALRHAKKIATGPRPVLTAAGAGLVLAGLFALGRLLTGESLLVGSGYRVLAWASEPGRAIGVLAALLVLRCLATSVAVAGGGVGGLFVPLVVAGSLTGSIVGNLVDRGDLTLFIIVGVAAFLGAGYRVPLAGVMFVAETTGRPSFVVPGLLAAVAAELVMGNSSITHYQRRTTIERTAGATPSAATDPSPGA